MIRKSMLMLPKVNRATPQSVFGDGFYPDKRDSKLYFEQLGIYSAAQNNLAAGSRTHAPPKSGHVWKVFKLTDKPGGFSQPLNIRSINLKNESR